MKFTWYCTLSGLALATPHATLAMPASVSSNTPLSVGVPPAGFAADPSINVDGIYAAALASNNYSRASNPTSPERKTFTNIYGDWQNFSNVSAFHFIADMDVDCDGLKVNTCLLNLLTPLTCLT